MAEAKDIEITGVTAAPGLKTKYYCDKCRKLSDKRWNVQYSHNKTVVFYACSRKHAQQAAQNDLNYRNRFGLTI